MEDQLQTLRTQIDEIDQELIMLLAKRFAVTEQVGIAKRDSNAPAQDVNREAAQFEKLKNLAKKAELDEAVVQPIWRAIIDQVIARHTVLRNASNEK